jgi:hypothetical protein
MATEDAPFAELRRRLAGRAWDDPLALDRDTAERLVSGRMDPADAPPGYAEVVALLAAAAAPTGDPDRERAAAAHLAAVVRSSARSSTPPRRRGPGRLRGARAAIAIAAILLLGGAAAAATGTLPAPVGRTARTVPRTGEPPAASEPAAGGTGTTGQRSAGTVGGGAGAVVTDGKGRPRAAGRRPKARPHRPAKAGRKKQAGPAKADPGKPHPGIATARPGGAGPGRVSLAQGGSSGPGPDTQRARPGTPASPQLEGVRVPFGTDGQAALSPRRRRSARG